MSEHRHRGTVGRPLPEDFEPWGAGGMLFRAFAAVEGIVDAAIRFDGDLTRREYRVKMDSRANTVSWRYQECEAEPGAVMAMLLGLRRRL